MIRAIGEFLLVIALYFVLAVLFVFFLVTIPANASEIDIDIGMTHFTPASNGIWYQEGFPHSLQLDSPSLRLSWFSNDLGDGWQIGAGYDYAGRAHVSSADVVDANYNPSTPNHCNGACWPFIHWKGSGEVDAVFLGVRKSFAHWVLESGVMADRPTWVSTSNDWISCPTCSPQSVTLRHEARIRLDPYASIGYRLNDRFSLFLTAIPTHISVSDLPGVYRGYSPSLSIEYSFN